MWKRRFSKRLIYPLPAFEALRAASPTQSSTKLTFVPSNSDNLGTTTFKESFSVLEINKLNTSCHQVCQDETSKLCS